MYYADVIITRGFYCVKITFLYFSYLHNLKMNITSHDIHPQVHSLRQCSVFTAKSWSERKTVWFHDLMRLLQ